MHFRERMTTTDNSAGTSASLGARASTVQDSGLKTQWWEGLRCGRTRQVIIEARWKMRGTQRVRKESVEEYPLCRVSSYTFVMKTTPTWCQYHKGVSIRKEQKML